MTELEHYVESALAAAEADWRSDVGEHRREVDGALDRMFKLSGFSSAGVPKDPEDRVPEWCGMAVFSWLAAAGLNPGFNTSFLHVYNVEAFFSYGRFKNVNPRRLDTEVKLVSGWQPITQWHDDLGAVREWWRRSGISREVGAGSPDIFKPGDVILLDWSGRNDADHIAMVRSWDPGSKRLTCFEGNRTGLGPAGDLRRESVVTVEYDLSRPRTLAKVYGAGRLSVLDFGVEAVRPRGARDDL